MSKPLMKSPWKFLEHRGSGPFLQIITKQTSTRTWGAMLADFSVRIPKFLLYTLCSSDFCGVDRRPRKQRPHQSLLRPRKREFYTYLTMGYVDWMMISTKKWVFMYCFNVKRLSYVHFGLRLWPGWGHMRFQSVNNIFVWFFFHIVLDFPDIAAW